MRGLRIVCGMEKMYSEWLQEMGRERQFADEVEEILRRLEAKVNEELLPSVHEESERRRRCRLSRLFSLRVIASQVFVG